MIRLFTAINLPDSVLNAMEGIFRGLPGVRWMKRDLIHLTLNFIGDVDREIFLDLRDSLSEVHGRSFEIKIRGVGQFSHRGASGVIWAGVDPVPELIKLQRDISSVLKPHGVKIEKRDFVPHITIARMKSVHKTDILEYLNEFSGFETESFSVREFSLYSSVLRPEGPLHTVEAVYGIAL